MLEPEYYGRRLQGLYWKTLVQLKVECEYIRRYQALLDSWVTRIAVIRAGASAVAVGGWAVVKSYPIFWGSIIASAQIADAMQGAFPINRRHQATSALVLGLDALFITAQAEWEELYAGRIDEEGIRGARHRLMRQMHDIQAKHLPTGLPRRDKLFQLAEADAAAYFEAIYSVETGDG